MVNGTTLSVSVSKLQCVSDYRSWKRSFEIQLSAKCKLVFLTGSIPRYASDVVQAAQWDTCNDLVVSWLHRNVADGIKQSIFINSASEPTRDLYALRQNNMKLNDYFSTLSSLWEDIESMNALPVITTVAADVTAFISAIDKYKAKSRLLQFLNGLDDMYVALRSQLLMQNPLPSVDVAFSTLQQEESQRDLFGSANQDAAAMYDRSQNEYKGPACQACGQKNHSGDKCWTVIGYPRWHRKYKPLTSKPQSIVTTPKQPKRTNLAVQESASPDVTLTTQQMQQLLKMLPPTAVSNNASLSITDDELENCFSGMVSCHMSTTDNTTWIVDSGARDHMTFSIDILSNVRAAPPDVIIKLPTGASAKITHIGNLILKSVLVLKKVLYVPQFQHNLMSIHRLSEDNNCVVHFYPKGCTIIDAATKRIQANGALQNVLYYLKDELVVITANSVSKQPISDYAL
ncbi:uncharacterized protein LOC141704308 [Apium graveolens]|uniref:uncharacterized protein LOC141683642 n=1 Tax=Apium graveolens TaxID=4045 RepID=UPI003D7A84E3